MPASCIRSLIIVGLLAGAAGATPISFISAGVIPVSFSPAGGEYENGVLSVNGTQPLVLHYSDGSHGVILDVSFDLSTSLKDDVSMGGTAKGSFAGGSLVLRDSGQNELLSGSVASLSVEETFDNLGIFGVAGLFNIESGSLVADFGSSVGSIYQIVFQAKPAALDDFGTAFGGNGNISLAPEEPEGSVVPEPGPVCLLALGLGGLVALPWWRRGFPALLCNCAAHSNEAQRRDI